MLVDEIRNIKSTKKDLRDFGLVVGIVLMALGGVLFWYERESYPYFISVGMVLVVSGLAIPGVLKPFQKAWMTVAVVIGWFMTRLILSVVFYIVFTSIGIISRLFNKRFMELETELDRESYWNYRPQKEYDRIDHEKQF
jgi:hypothetical protein